MENVAANPGDYRGGSSVKQDLIELWGKMPHKVAFIIGLALWGVVFQVLGNSTFGYIDTHSLFEWMFNAYNAPYSEDGHGNLIPFAVAALIIWKRRQLLAISYATWWPAVLLLGFGMALHVVGFIAQQARISVLGMFVALFGMTGMCWGKSFLKTILFPFVLFLFCVPIGSLAQPFTFPLRVLVTTLAVGISDHLLQIDVVQQGTIIMDAKETFSYDVAAACSGIRSLVTLVPLTLVFGFIAYSRYWKRALVLLASIPFAIAGNTLRLVLVIMIGNAYGQDAGKYWEQKLGFLTFLIAILGIFLLDIWLKEPINEDQSVAERESV